MDSRERILTVLSGGIPDRVPFAPNLWQWFEFQKTWKLLPQELADCQTHLDAMRILGVDIFSRNLLTDIRRDWFGGHVRYRYSTVKVHESQNDDRRTLMYETPHGRLSESFLFQKEGCTLVQDEYLFKDFKRESEAWKDLFEDRELVLDTVSLEELTSNLGAGGVVIAGEVTSPLKQLHLCARADHSTFLLHDHEKSMLELMDIYAEKALEMIDKLVRSGIKVVMTMDNLDSIFYPPPYFERYCSRFFSRASEICHQNAAFLFSHACGHQKSILRQVIDCGIDGLEGIAFPPLGDVELWEAKKVGDRFIVEGGLSAIQLEGEVTLQQAEKYVRELFMKMKPLDRFIFSMSCNTSIKTSWDTLRYYRDAWLKHGNC